MAELSKDVLLRRIIKEVNKGRGTVENISNLSPELQKEIEGTIPPEITCRGLKNTLDFLREFIPQQYINLQCFKMPETLR